MKLGTYLNAGQKVFVHGAAATPNELLKMVIDEELIGLEFYSLHTETRPGYAERLAAGNRIVNLFVGRNYRKLMNYDTVDYLPCFLSEIPQLFRRRKIDLDVALVHVSPPDRHGFCSLGTSVDCARAAVESAKVVLAQVNQQMPRVHGDGIIHISKITDFIEVNEPLPEVPSKPLNAIAKKIGVYVAALIEDGSTIQAGIGGVPDACLAALSGHRNLGLHSEMWSDHAMALIEAGVVNNSKKVVHPGKTVSTFVTGSRKVYDFLHDNPSAIQLEASYVNQPNVIARNPRVAAINSCVEMDLTGQICADSVGHRIISGVGGQMDFMRGAALSREGKPIMAFTSRTEKCEPRIVATLKPGSGVVTTRSHVHWVATEWGARDLSGLSLSKRARALIEIAHPDDREKLMRDFHELSR